MKITEIRIKLMEASEDRLRAFCSITIDDSFVVRDLKIIDGSSGPFVAMPSRKLTGHCKKCNHKNHLRANYCNHCGAKIRMNADSGYDSPQKLYADVAHPINSQCREDIQNVVIDEFNLELERAAQPGYRSRYDDDFQDFENEVAEPESISIFGDADTDEMSLESSEPETTNIIDGPEDITPRPHFLEAESKPERTRKRRRGERAKRQRDVQQTPPTQSKSSLHGPALPKDESSQTASDTPADDSFGAGIFDD